MSWSSATHQQPHRPRVRLKSLAPLALPMAMIEINTICNNMGIVTICGLRRKMILPALTTVTGWQASPPNFQGLRPQNCLEIICRGDLTTPLWPRSSKEPEREFPLTDVLGYLRPRQVEVLVPSHIFFIHTLQQCLLIENSLSRRQFHIFRVFARILTAMIPQRLGNYSESSNADADFR